jgi:hypothetical protein
MDLDYKAALFWVSFANFVWIVVLTIYVRYANSRKATAASIDALVKTIVADRMEIEKRFGHVQSELARRVTHDDISPLYERVNDVANSLSSLDGQMMGISNNLQMIQGYLLNQGSQK